MIEHTYIELFGLELADPLTFVSDIMMTIVAFYCGHRIFHDYSIKYSKLVGLFFFFLGVSSMLGGTSHLLDFYFGKTPHLIAWLTQGVSILFIEMASLTLIKSRKVKNLLRMIVFAFFGVFISQLFSIQHFNVVKINSTIGLIGVTSGIHIAKYFATKETVYLKVPLSICLFILPALVHGFDLRINAWFNQNVISHLILLPCYYVVYRSFSLITEHHTTSKTQPIQQ